MALLTPLDVTRRIAALAGFILLIALAVTLLWRVYVHHVQADPYERDEAVTVRLESTAPAANVTQLAKFTARMS